MSLQRILTVSSLFIFFASPLVTRAEVVTCNHNTPVCECIATNPNNDVCEFTFDIEMLQTFTRYLLDDTGDSRGTAGSVWHINNGEWEPVDYDPSMNSNTLCGSSIDSTNCTQPFGVDGYTFRSFIAVNGRIPGPTLIVTEGQLVKVTVINRLASESVSVHWHGMHQRNSNWMDGVEHVTQCGIPPGASFTYIFNATQYGTHWYHSHSGAQRTDGLFGALIVRENDIELKNKLLEEVKTLTGFNITDYEDNPEDHTLTLLDWQRSSSLDLFTQIHSGIRYFDIDRASELQGSGANRTYSSDGAEIGPVSYWSGLINGRGRHNSVSYMNSNLSEFKVTAGETYRFRLIGAQSLYAYRFSIEDHNLTVIATDGQFIEPETVDYIIIHSGERYDFLLKAKEENELVSTQQFMIRAVTLRRFPNSSTIAPNYIEEESAEAILNYNDVNVRSSQYAGIATNRQPVSQRCTAIDKCIALNCPFQNFPQSFNIDCMHITDLSRLTIDPANELPTIATDDTTRLFFNFGFEGTRLTSAVNARNLKLPSASLAQLDENEYNNLKDKEFCKGVNETNACNRDIGDEVMSPECYCTHVVDVEANKYIELVISATGPDYTDINPRTSKFLFAHPVHLHGHYFHVVDIQFGPTNEESGILRAGTTDIDCGCQSIPGYPMLCNNPSWKAARSSMYNHENTGKINPKAPLKDTLLIPAGGYAVVYFKTDNPGWWFLHCHIEVHQLEGMGVIINEGRTKRTPPDSMLKCGNFSLTIDEFKGIISNNTSALTPVPTLVILLLLVLLSFYC